MNDKALVNGFLGEYRFGSGGAGCCWDERKWVKFEGSNSICCKPGLPIRWKIDNPAHAISLSSFAIVGYARIDDRDGFLGQFDRDVDICEVSNLELVLRSYLKWGSRFLNYIHGDFVFAIWDSHQEMLILVRDRLGVYPLYYYCNSECIVFATHPDSIATHLGIVNKTNSDWIVNSISSVHIEDTRRGTIFNDIELFPNATKFRVNRVGSSMQRYWSLNIDNKLEVEDEVECLERFRSLFKRAVINRIPVGRKTGFELSGGLDCNAILSVASKGNVGGLSSFYAYTHSEMDRYGGSGRLNEENLARSTCSELGLSEPSLLKGENITAMDLLARNSEPQGYLNLDIWSIFNVALYRKASSDGCDVILSGAGGDELVSSEASAAYFDFLVDFDVHRLCREAFYEAKRKNWNIISMLKRIFSISIKAGYPNLSKWIFGTPSESITGHYLRDEVASDYKIWDRKLQYFEELTQGRLREKQVSMLDGAYLSCYRMPNSFLESYKFGMRISYPMLDEKLVEFCLSLPSRMKRKNGYGRSLVREAVVEMPQKLRFRESKRMPALPWAVPLVNRDSEILASMCDSAKFSELIDVPKLKKDLLSLKTGVANDRISRRELHLSLCAALS